MVLTGYGFLDQTRFGGTTREITEIPKGAAESGKLKWKDFFNSSYKRFSRLDALSQYAVIAVELMGLPAMEKKSMPLDAALVMGTEFGCLGVDVEYLKSMDNPEGGCPSLFAYTLPSVALGEIAIHYGLTGSNLCLRAGPESGLLAVWEAYYMIVSGEAQACLCLDCDALLLPRIADLAPAAKDKCMDRFTHSWAFLFETDRSAHENDRLPLARINRQYHPPEQGLRQNTRVLLEQLCLLLCNASDGGNNVLSLPPPNSMRVEEALTICLT